MCLLSKNKNKQNNSITKPFQNEVEWLKIKNEVEWLKTGENPEGSWQVGNNINNDWKILEVEKHLWKWMKSRIVLIEKKKKAMFCHWAAKIKAEVLVDGLQQSTKDSPSGAPTRGNPQLPQCTRLRLWEQER